MSYLSIWQFEQLWTVLVQIYTHFCELKSRASSIASQVHIDFRNCSISFSCHPLSLCQIKVSIAKDKSWQIKGRQKVNVKFSLCHVFEMEYYTVPVWLSDSWCSFWPPLTLDCSVDYRSGRHRRVDTVSLCLTAWSYIRRWQHYCLPLPKCVTLLLTVKR